MSKINLASGEMPRATKRTTVQNYDADLELARAVLDERTGFEFTVHETEEDDQIQKSIDDALNNEWQRGITVEKWVGLVLEAIGYRRRA